MAYQQPGSGSSSAPFQPTASHSQGPSTSQPAVQNQQYGAQQGATMLPPQRPFQANSTQLNNTTSARSTGAPPSAQQQPTHSQSGATSGMTVAAVPPATAKAAPTSDPSGQAKPVTPKAGNLSAMDQERVTALLNLNALILRELQHLQSIGAAVPPVQASPQQQNASVPQKTPDAAGEAQRSPTGSSSTPTTTTPTPQTPKLTRPPPKAIYDNYLKRLQVNIAYLLALSGARPVPAHPGAMESPNESWFQPLPGETTTDEAMQKRKETARQFQEGYQKLRELWPNYKRPPRPTPPQQQQQQQQQQTILPSPPAPLQQQSMGQDKMQSQQVSGDASQLGPPIQSTQEQTHGPTNTQAQSQPPAPPQASAQPQPNSNPEVSQSMASAGQGSN